MVKSQRRQLSNTLIIPKSWQKELCELLITLCFLHIQTFGEWQDKANNYSYYDFYCKINAQK